MVAVFVSGDAFKVDDVLFSWVSGLVVSVEPTPCVLTAVVDVWATTAERWS